MTLKIEAGKFYRTRDGHKVGPMNVPPKSKHWSGIVVADATYRSQKYGWLEGGRYLAMRESEHDLIAEWTDEREVGTLREIGAKRGDVVEYEGIQFAVVRAEQPDCEQYFLRRADNGRTETWAGDDDNWRIIRRADGDKPYIQCPNGDRIYAGEYGRTRDGCRVGPMIYEDCHRGYPWTVRYGRHGFWSNDGEWQKVSERHATSFIAKWTDEPAAPEVGTLRDLGVKPGDVVEWIGMDREYTVDQNGVLRHKDNGWINQTCDEDFRIISRASEALPYGHARLPDGRVVDLKAITAAFGLLDSDTQAAMQAHGGPWERYTDDGKWVPSDHPAWYLGDAYRVAHNPPEPVVPCIEFDENGDITADGAAENLLISCRLTLPVAGGRLVPGTYTGPDGLEIKVEAL